MAGLSNAAPGFWRVFMRELVRLPRQPFVLVLTIIVPLVAGTIFSFVLSGRLATNMPIAVLDQDASILSRQIIRAVEATPDVVIKSTVDSLAEAKRQIIAGNVYGALYIPQYTERDVQAGRSPEVVVFYNTQMLSPGNFTLRGVSGAVNAMIGQIQVGARSAQGTPIDAATAAISPIPVQSHGLFNPALDYSHFLLASFIPTVLQIVMIVASVYTIGTDVATPHRLRVLRRSAGSISSAILGKILPYTVIFYIVLGVLDLSLFTYFELPMRGNFGLLQLSTVLFILASQLIGAVLAVYIRPYQKALSIGALMFSPAFGFMGVAFPRLGMNAFAYGYSHILPGTYYLMVRADQTIRGAPEAVSAHTMILQIAMVIVLALLVWGYFLRAEKALGQSGRQSALKEASA